VLRAFETQWFEDGTGPLAGKFVELFVSFALSLNSRILSGLDAGIKLRPNAQDLEQLTPLFVKRWETFFVESPDKAVAFIVPWAA
jgi:hypothetical protein